MGLTKDQIKSINHKEGNALVSASAGSGKTYVVINRILELLKSNVSLNNILATTFTEAAAAEMKEKLKDELLKEINENDNPSLTKQLELISVSEISTIDSFCMNILKNYFYEIGIDDCFSVCDDQDSLKYKTMAVELVFDELYESKDKEFFHLIDSYREGKRGDEKLRNEILNIINFCSTEESIDVVRNRTINTYNNPVEIVNKIIYGRIINTIDYILNEASLLGYDFAGPQNPKVREQFENFTLELRKLKTCKNISEAYSQSVLISDLGNKQTIKGDVEPKKAAKYAELYGKYKDVINEIGNSNYSSEQAIIENSNQCISDIGCLFNLAQKVEDKYTELKKEDNKIDFSDIERFTLKILENESIRKTISNKYKYIFIDEYQDTNPLQEKIISLIGNNNLFLVGDSKQSIYGFRGCDPKFFNGKRDLYESNNSLGINIDLDENFRSAESIINGVNEIFTRIMKKDKTGVDYEKNPMKYGGLYYNEKGVFEVNTPKLEKVETQENEGVETAENSKEDKEEKKIREEVYSLLDAPLIGKDEYSDQTKLIINLIKENIGKEYFDIKEKTDDNLSEEENIKKKIKKLEQKDFAILGRNKTRFAEIADALIKCGFTVNYETNDSINDYPEVKCIVNLLRYIDFKNQDVPLVNTMISFGNFTEEELISIRMGKTKKLTFYECVELYKNENNEIAEKVKKFLDYFDKVRMLAGYIGVSELLIRIIQETGFDGKLKSTFLGKQKYQRVMRIIQEGQKGGKIYKVNEFLEYLKNALPKIKEDECKSEDAIKILTIHKSKGLEYPFVILIDTQTSFSTQDKNSNVVKSKEYGLGLPIYYFEDKIKVNSIIKDCIKEKINENTIVEEMRLLYVALTRAKCEMHIVVMEPEKEKKPINEAKCYYDFLDLDKISQREVSLNEITNDKESSKKSQKSLDINNAIQSNLSFSYPYIEDITVPVKQSVSVINKDYLTSEGISPLFFEKTEEKTSAEEGVLYHKVLENINFYGELNSELNSLLNSGIISQEEYENLNKERLSNILKMDIFKEIKGCKLYKEKGFCILVDAKDYGHPNSNEKILVQGIIDLLAVSEDKIILIDYKLSSIYNREDLIKEYEMQIKLYKEAVEKLLGRKVNKACLVNISSCIEVEV